MAKKSNNVSSPSIFKFINLDNARGKDEKFEGYKERRKLNQIILKFYKQLGPTTFRKAFPTGVTYEGIKEIFNQSPKIEQNVNTEG
jgi:hypothetical protein|tara:strand:- start:155 stop:412 length:258 start_codon:yes stop_codon:yes gene_type:complete